MLSTVSSAALHKLRSALTAEKLGWPATQDSLNRAGIRTQRAEIEAVLAPLNLAGGLAVIDAVLAERETQERPPPELVWTGPEGVQATARDTAVVLGQLFAGARERVVLAGYSFRDARKVLEPLHRVMAERDVLTVMLVDVAQPTPDQVRGEAWGQAELARFLGDSWPFGAPYPELHCDRRALSPAPPWCSLHAKCVSVDGSKAFLSSANFTERGQERNLEAGVLIHDKPFAQQLERQWSSLIASGLTYRYREQGEKGDAAAPTTAANDGFVSAFEDLYPHTREPEALAWLAKQRVPAPDDTGMDIAIDDEVVACAEWRWLDRRVALLAANSKPESDRVLQAAGWRAIASTDEHELRRLVHWLQEARA